MVLFPNVYNLAYNAGQRLQILSSNHEITMSTLPSLFQIWHYVSHIPLTYKDWWLDLVTNEPVHVFIETALLLTMVYIVLSQSREWKGMQKSERLSEAEKQELLLDWRLNGRHPLAPPNQQNEERQGGDANSNANSSRSSGGGKVMALADRIVVEEVNGRTMKLTFDGEWSEPRTVLNFATHDFLGMSSFDPSSSPESVDSNNSDNGNNETDENDNVPKQGADDAAPGTLVKDASRQALSKYGCGSCGPRGFYGTIDVHLQLEKSISKFTGTDDAILYSDGASTISSTVAAFAKRGDLLVVDEGVYEPLVTGVTLSRANVKWFRHNDMDDLRRVLERIRETDTKLGRKTNDQRRFIVVEGLYKNLGSIVPLTQLVALKNEFNYRLILDESFSFGTLGPTGKGVVELYGKKLMHDAEIVTISLENTLGSVGGVTVGNEEVVDHQRLSGAGYCFSASTPPFTASAAMAALEQMESRPELLQRLNENKKYLYGQLKSVLGAEAGASGSGIVPEKLLIASDERSPIVLLEVADVGDEDDAKFEQEIEVLDAIVKDCLRDGVAMVSTGAHVTGLHMHAAPAPAIRMTVSAVHTKADIQKAVAVIKKAALQHLCQS